MPDVRERVAGAPLPLRPSPHDRLGEATASPEDRELVRALAGLRGVAGGGWRLAAGAGIGTDGVTVAPEREDDNHWTPEEVLKALSNGTVCPTCGPKGMKPIVWRAPSGKRRYLFKCCGTSVDKESNEYLTFSSVHTGP